MPNLSSIAVPDKSYYNDSRDAAKDNKVNITTTPWFSDMISSG